VTTTTDSLVTATPELDAQALFPEARERRRRRWSVGIAVLIVVGSALVLSEGFDDRGPSPHARAGLGLPQWTPPKGSARPVPAVYVSGNGTGGVGVYSTATGSLIRVLSPQGGGGPDQQVVLSGDRRSVFFTQPSGACTGDILSGPISGLSVPGVVISDPDTLALAPSPSPTSSELAWVGVICASSDSVTTATLYVTNLATGERTSLGLLTGRQSDNSVSWSPDGTRLAVENGNTVVLYDVTSSSFALAQAMHVAHGCTLSSPKFLQSNQLAVIRTCPGANGSSGTSEAVAFDIATGKPSALIASAPRGSTFQGVSVDDSGQHLLLGMVTDVPAGAQNVQVVNRRLVTVSRDAVTDAEW
jgi:WD40 repeat protein